LIPAGGDPKSALLIDRTVDDGLVSHFTARPEVAASERVAP
jgi:D-methionine transport system substrate-binding protein